MKEIRVDVAAIYQPDHYLLEHTAGGHDLYRIHDDPTGIKIVGGLKFQPENFKKVDFAFVKDGEQDELIEADIWTILLDQDFATGALRHAVVLDARGIDRARALNQLSPLASKSLLKVFGV